ncbi:LysR family transcriptional regulator [Pseudomonas sp. B2M1-30]|uniref:LysR family transcriptional regulator n=1 Tax=Pseudomonas TaxID=286 RepID=UPI0021C87B2A|nr:MULTISPECIES: LysR family transcriptional regulator [Pseudomonas]MCU0119911.1 LysR family transcriptional regulator [Pseudomonas sp. B2M1-30]MCU7261922.1 LysR family transcriptional regulator [Pseudomonas koreensis]
MNNLRRLDINLLLTLDVLLAEHNVTRAAQRLNLSQPSVSVHLAKLRDIFGDPLLLPGPRGMRPTVRADELREPLREALEALERAVAPASPFDPALAIHTWKISATDYGESTIVLPALSGLRTQAPGTRLAVVDLLPGQMVKQAEQGLFDLALHITEGAPPELHQRPLFTERYVLAGRIGHPGLNAPPTREQFCALEHVMVSREGGGFWGTTDNALADVGLSRKVVLSVPHFLLVMSVLASTDLVAMLPSRLVRGHPALQVVDAPLQVPGYEMAMFWGERSHRDPAHKWLREHLAASV